MADVTERLASVSREISPVQPGRALRAALASQDYNNILNQQRAQDTQFTGALTNFVAALAGSKAGTTTAA